MNLSIFNFNSIYKIIFLFVILFGLYNLFLVLEKPDIKMFQNQWQKNYSFAQDFIYENKAENIIVGSSMAARMQNDFLPKDFYNLSFSGGSVLTGLEIIKKSGFIPKNIYIETNIIFRNKDNKLLNNLFYPILWQIKKHIPVLQEKYQPLNLVASKIRGSYGKTHKEHMQEKRNEKIFNLTIQRRLKNYNKSLESYENKLSDLKILIEYFSKKGVNIVFFEMPIENRLANSIKAKEQRKIIKNNFANKWFKLPSNDNYVTADGIHLIFPSAFKFSKEFVKDIYDKQ